MDVRPEAPAWVGAAASLIRRLPRGRYRATNLVGRGGARPFWARLPDDLGGFVFRCDLRDPITREVCFTGRYEPQETALLQQILRPGLTCVDVGANWGYFTLAAAHRVGQSGRAIAVEADPAACAALRANAARNRLEQVTVVEMAASDRRGAVELQQYDARASQSGNYGLAGTTTVVRDGRRFQVAAGPLDRTLDELCVESIDLLKMDIEGGEARALAGLAQRLGSRRIERILLEIHPQHLRDQGSSAALVLGDLRRHGYQIWAIDHSAVVTRKVAAGRLDVASALTPLVDPAQLEPWPHVLCTLDGDGPLGSARF